MECLLEHTNTHRIANYNYCIILWLLRRHWTTVKCNVLKVQMTTGLSRCICIAHRPI